jgi:hypothetical protein
MIRALFVIPIGFEPMTYRLEICCSIQLSYGTIASFSRCKYAKNGLNRQ